MKYDDTDYLINREESIEYRISDTNVSNVEENKEYIVQLTDEQYRNLVDVIRKEVKKEFEQKVKDLIKNETINISGFECIAVENVEELLEEK